MGPGKFIRLLLLEILDFISVNPPGGYLATALLFLGGFLVGWWSFEQVEIL